MNNLQVGKKALITCDNWFYAPNGKEYRAVFGTVHGVHSSEETLGVKTNAKSTNWYVVIGNMTLAGCQIHYAIRCDKAHTDRVGGWGVSDGKVNEYTRPSVIYDADEQG